MKKAIKWILISVGALVALMVIAAVIIVTLVDANQYKPLLEKKATEALGVPLRIGGEISFSVFPAAGFAISDVHLGNPTGYSEPDMASVGRFEARVRLFPLLFSKGLHITRFVLESPLFVMEKDKAGVPNVSRLGKSFKTPPTAPQTQPVDSSPTAFPFQEFSAGEVAVRNGTFKMIDHQAGTRNTLSGLNVTLEGLSFDHPIGFSVALELDGLPLSLNGKIGPVTRNPMTATLPLSVTAGLPGKAAAMIDGSIRNLAGAPMYDVALSVPAFSPKDLASALKFTGLPKTADEKALSRVSVKAKAKGGATAVTVSDGELILDDSRMTFKAAVHDTAKPDVTFSAELDRIDLDRYLPPKSAEAKPEAEKTPPAKAGKTDYGPLRKLKLDGRFTAGEVRASGMAASNVRLHVSAERGVIRLDPATADLFRGTATIGAVMNVQKDTPETKLNVKVADVQSGPVLRQVLNKDLLEGALHSETTLSFTGDTPDAVLKSAVGQGSLLFTDGMLKGFDLAGMVRNTKAALGLAPKDGERPKTDFSELAVPFSLSDGLFNVTGAHLKSPFLRLLAGGKADLLKKTLDFTIEPKLVASMTGQGDEANRSGILVPVKVSGTFEKPSFRPDLENMIKQKAQEAIASPEKLKEVLKGGPATGEALKSLIIDKGGAAPAAEPGAEGAAQPTPTPAPGDEIRKMGETFKGIFKGGSKE